MKWKSKVKLWLIAIIVISTMLIITVLCRKDNDTIGAISFVAGVASIVLAIIAIIQSYAYDKRSSQIYDEMNKTLSDIDTKQDKLYSVIDELKSNTDTNPSLSDEAKFAIKTSLDKVPDMYYSGASRPIQKKERKVIDDMIKKDLSDCIKKRRGLELLPEEDFINIKANYNNTNLYFTYSIRNTITGENWPTESAEEFFTSRINTYMLNKNRLKGVWIIIIVYSDSVYYCITDSERIHPVQKKISLGEGDVLKNKEWTVTLMNDVDTYIK